MEKTRKAVWSGRIGPRALYSTRCLRTRRPCTFDRVTWVSLQHLPVHGFGVRNYTQMSCRASIYDAFRLGCRGRATLSVPRVQVHQSALSRSITLRTNPVRGQQDPKAGVQLRRNFTSTHIQGHVKNPAEPDHLDSMPVNAWSDCSVNNEGRWKSFAPAKGATGTLCAGRSILLTGGTSGIGLAVAKRAVLESASHVIIVSRRPSKGAGAVRAITEATECPDAPVSYLSHDFSTCSPELISSILKPLVSQTFSMIVQPPDANL
jgi:hypothetical protein